MQEGNKTIEMVDDVVKASEKENKSVSGKTDNTSNKKTKGAEKVRKAGDPQKAKEIDSNVAAMIYSKLNNIFGGSQLFTMEFPGRVLNQMDYAYPIENYNSSSLTKPYVVAENEFRLSDSLYDLSPIVQGSNGSKLSTVYNTVINNFTPKIDDIKDFIIDKMELRIFLLQKITDQINGETITCSRLEFCQRLYQNYLKEKYNWDQEKLEKQEIYTNENKLDEYAKWLATTAWTKDHELESLFKDAIIRGFYHEIMTIVGYIDIASPAELLSKAKENRRSSVRRSYDGSMDVLPVQFQPSNWFRSLSPNFSPKDLTLGREFLILEYQSKQELLSSLEAELRVLLAKNIGDDDIKALQDNLVEMKKSLVSEEKTYFKEFTEAQIDAIKLAFEIIAKGDIVGFIGQGEANLANVIGTMQSKNFEALIGVTTEGFQKLMERTFTLYSKHLDYFNTYKELVDVQLALANASTSKYNNEIEIIKERIRIVQGEVSRLFMILTSDAVSTEDIFNDTEVLPISKYNEDSEFSDIIFKTSEFQNLTEEQKKSVYYQFAGRVGNLFFNSSTDINYSASSSAFLQSVYDSDCTIGMRVTKVAMERGGWFDPSIIDISSSFMRLKEKVLSGAGLTVDQVMNAFNSTENEKMNGRYTALSKLLKKNTGESYIFPAFPAAFVIAKDVVIKARMTNFSEEDYKEFRKTTASTSTSVFGFKVSGGGSSESYMGYSAVNENEVIFYMRIPGPQILGWFMELTAEDKSTPYESLSQSDYFDKIIDSLKAYEEKLNTLSGADGSGKDKDVFDDKTVVYIRE